MQKMAGCGWAHKWMSFNLYKPNDLKAKTNQLGNNEKKKSNIAIRQILQVEHKVPATYEKKAINDIYKNKILANE